MVLHHNARVAVAVLLAASGSVAFSQATNTFPANGNVGIGTTSPTYPLSVSVEGTAAQNLAFFAEPSLSNGNMLSIALGPQLSNYVCGALQFTYVEDGSASNFVDRKSVV